MLGAIIGDIIGSVYEFNPTKSLDFPLFSTLSKFTDDTVLTVAVASCLLDGKDCLKTLKDFTLRYPNSGYGGRYYEWAHSESNQPYNSYGNGSAMRVSPVGFAFSTRKDVLVEAKKSASVTHNHREGIKGAHATALAIFLTRQGASKYEIKTQIASDFGYNLKRNYQEIQPDYRFDETCQGSVPEAFYKEIPFKLITQTARRLPQEFVEIIKRFYLKFLDRRVNL